MTARFGNNLGGWFLNISTVIAGFIATGQGENAWVMNVDAAILAGVSQGYSAYIENPNSPSGGLTNGGNEWFTFFQMFDNRESDRNLINQWGIAERAGTKDGTDQYGNAPWYGWSSPRSDDRYFEVIGGGYRLFQGSVCGKWDCTNSFFDPRITDAQLFGSQYEFSPVWRALALFTLLIIC